MLERLGIWFGAPDPRPKAEIEDEIREEIEFHLALAGEANEASGLAPDEARSEAERRFGNVERVFAACREVQLGERIMLQRVNVVLIILLVIGVAANLLAGSGARADLRHEVAVLREDVTTLVGHLNGNQSVTLVPPERRVFLVGAVKSPGPVPWYEGLTLSMAISERGGLESHVDARRVSLVRAEGDIEVVDVRALVYGTAELGTLFADFAGKPEMTTLVDPLLRPGDRIILPGNGN